MFSSAVVLASVGILSAQSKPALSIEDVMTVTELRSTGIGRLNIVQRAALDKWLSEYTMKLVTLLQKSGTKPAATFRAGSESYLGSAGGHWIDSTSSNGSLIVLEDGSMWEIESADRIDTSLWLPVTDITILKASAPVGDYKYILVNKDDGEKRARKVFGQGVI
jgi:hypothetical protein